MKQDNRYQLIVDVTIMDRMDNGRLRVSHSVNIETADFLDMMKILGEFKALADKHEKN